MSLKPWMRSRLKSLSLLIHALTLSVGALRLKWAPNILPQRWRKRPLWQRCCTQTCTERDKSETVSQCVQQPLPACTLVNDLLGVVHTQQQQQAPANIYLRPPADKVAALRCSPPEHSRDLHYFSPSPVPFPRPSCCYTELIIDGIIKTARQVTSLDSFAVTFINK